MAAKGVPLSHMIKSLSIVMPCYNEEQAIPSLMPRVLNSLENLKKTSKIQDYELIVVNDSSTDKSEELLKEFEKIHLVSAQGPRGYGAALKAGFQNAKGDWVGFFDVDNSYRPEDLGRFVEEAKEGRSDFIMGARGLNEKGMSATRGLGNWTYQFLAKTIYKSYLTDVCSGYRLFHRRHLREIFSIPENGLDFSIHLTLMMLMNKVFIKQIPIQYDARIGDSKLSLIKDGLGFAKVLLTLKMRRSRAFKHSRV